MTERRHLRLVSREALGELSRLRFELIEDGPLGFRGGQFVFIDTGLELDEPEPGKTKRRAYSIASSDRNQVEFEVLVQDVARLENSGRGLASEAFCGRGPDVIELGAERSFSGPWGKFVGDELHDSESRLIVATDNGLSAALGFLRSSEQEDRLASIEFIWLHTECAACLAPDQLRRMLPDGLAAFDSIGCPPVGSEQRGEFASRELLKHLGGEPLDHLRSVWLVGDGAVVVPLSTGLVEAGLDANALRRVECFFNAPRN